MPSPIPFYKYHALGNDYLVLNPAETDVSLTSDSIQLICHRNFGIGSDGILLGPIKNSQSEFSLKIFNPDGSQAEKSGNGLRIFTRYLFDKGLIGSDSVSILTAGGPVSAQVYENGRLISVDMRRVSFDSRIIPVEGSEHEVINEKMEVNLTFRGSRMPFFSILILGDLLKLKSILKTHFYLNFTILQLFLNFHYHLAHRSIKGM